MDLQRGDLRVERPQGGRGGLLLVVQRGELDLYRRAGEAEGAPATEAQRSLGPVRAAAARFACAQGSALPCAPTYPNPRPMCVLISWDRAGRAGRDLCPQWAPTRVPAHASSRSTSRFRAFAWAQRLAERSPPWGSGRERPGPEGTPCPPLPATAPSRVPSEKAPPVKQGAACLAHPLISAGQVLHKPLTREQTLGPHPKAPDSRSCQPIQRLSSKSGRWQAPLQSHSLFSQ